MITEAEKDAIRAERASGLKLVEVGHRHDITRERVRQLCLESPNEAKRAREVAVGLGVYIAPPEQSLKSRIDEQDSVIVRFRNLDLHYLEDIVLQRKIRAELPNYSAISRKYGISRHAVEQIRKHKMTARPLGGCIIAKFTREERSAMAKKAWVTRKSRI